ncbi:MAG: T9SS type A sorting domain-containing protein [Ignavibacteriae bacterium]|nr:T9SS type A sorting domain-containing protein [Ignavibacteriota bacterium]
MRPRLIFYFVFILTTTASGNALEFTQTNVDTSGPPTFERYFINYVTGNAIKLLISFLPNGSETVAWIEWDTTSAYVNSTPPENLGRYQYGVQLEQTIIRLKPKTVYHFRGVAQNDYGITYGPDSTFQTATSGFISEAITLTADSITSTSARLRGKCKKNGSRTGSYFTYGPSWSQKFLLNTSKQYLGTDTSEVDISVTVNSLIPNTSYWFDFRVYSNIPDIGYVDISGGNQTFSTLDDSVTKGLVVPLHFIDHSGAKRILRFGVHTAATKCLDRSLGELEVPPMPPSGQMETRFMAGCFGEGTYIDLRPFSSSTQIDTYTVKFQTEGDGHPLNISWSNLDSLYNGKITLTTLLDTMDMKSTTMYEMTNPFINYFRIVAEGPRPIAQQPTVTTSSERYVGNSHGQIAGMINPKGLASISWFEWGPTPDYGKTTSIRDIGNEAGMLPFTTFLFGLNPNTSYHYRAVAQNSAGIVYGNDQTFTTTGTTGIGDNEQLPGRFLLKQNYPNPFNPLTTIEYHLPQRQNVEIEIYNSVGQLIKTLINTQQEPGSYAIQWNGQDNDGKVASSGTYFYQIKTDGVVQVKKMLLLK